MSKKQLKFHPFYFLIKPLMYFIFLGTPKLFINLANVYIVKKSEILDMDEIIPYLVVGAVITIIVSVLRFVEYKKSFIEIDENSIIYSSKKMFSKEYKESSIESISNITLKSTLIDKLMKVTYIQMDINSSQTAKTNDYKILVSKKEAEEFKKIYYKNLEVKRNLSKINDLDENKEEIESKDLEQKEKVAEYSLVDGIVHVLIDYTIMIVFLGAILIGIWDYKNNIFIGTAIIANSGIILRFIKKLLLYSNYNVYQNENRIVWNCGITERWEYSILKKNICAVIVKQSILARILKKYSVYIEVIGIGNERKEKDAMILYSRKEKTLNILNKLLSGNEVTTEFQREDVKIGIIKATISLLIVLSLGMIEIVRYYWIVWILSIVGIATITMVKSRGKGISLKNKKINILNVLFNYKSTTIEYENIDNICIENNIIMGYMGYKKAKLYYRESKGKNSLETGYFKKEVIDEMVKKIVNEKQEN